MKRISILKLAFRNLTHRRVRTSFLAAFVFILAASLMTSNVLTTSMEKCIDRTVDRIGADVIVAPEEFSAELSDSLFSGERCSFYFDRQFIGDIEGVDGIEQLSPQLYIATMSASCCSVPIQIVAFEAKTDFIVQPWIEEIGIKDLKKGQVVVGSRVEAKQGEMISFFGDDYEVAGKLDPTETSYDNCAFMDFETAYMLFESETIKYISDISDPSKVVSLLMIRSKENVDPKDIANEINYQLDTPLQAFTPASIFDQVSNTLSQMQSYSVLLIVLLFVMAVLALICIFNITVSERKREFGILMSVGTQKAKIFQMLILEAGIIGVAGGVLGIAIAGGGIYIFQEQIILKLDMPYLISGVKEYTQIALRCMVLSVATSMLSTLYAAVKLTRTEPFQLIQEVER